MKLIDEERAEQSFDPGWKGKAAWFLASQNLSLFGSGVVTFSILFHITLTTGSGLWMTLITIAALIPNALLSPWGGVLADRHSRKMLIMAADGCIAFATLLLAVAQLLGCQRLELLLLALAVRSAGAGIQTPAVNAVFPQIVPKKQLTRVQGVNQTLNAILLLVTPAAGGFVLAACGLVWAFMVDVVTALLAILVLARLKMVPVRRAGSDASALADLRRGIIYVRSHTVLRRLVVCFGISFFLFTPATVLSALMIKRSFAGDVWHLSANELVWNIGSLLGGVYVSVRGNFPDKIRIIAICMTVFGLFFALLGIADRFWIFLLLMGAAGLFLPAMVTAQTVLIQEMVEEGMMGRVFSLIQVVTALAMPVAVLLFGPLADIVPVESILIVSGLALAATGIVYGRNGYG